MKWKQPSHPPINKHSHSAPSRSNSPPPGSANRRVIQDREALHVWTLFYLCSLITGGVHGVFVCWHAASASGLQGLHWRVCPPGPEPLGPIRGCKYLMRYDSAAQTLLNHRPLTVFSRDVPFGKVRNNEINKHRLPPVTARALRGLHAARLLMRGSTPFLSCRMKRGSNGRCRTSRTAFLLPVLKNVLLRYLWVCSQQKNQNAVIQGQFPYCNPSEERLFIITCHRVRHKQVFWCLFMG